jgi:hypothetical protein
MSRHTTRDGSHDDGRNDPLAEALRGAVPAVPVDDVDWTALRARIGSAAEPLLAATRPDQNTRPRTWWQSLAGWSPHGIPLAAAATVLLMLAAGALRPGQADLPYPGSSFVTIEEELVNGLSAAARPLLAGGDTDVMLDAALFFDGEDW